MNDLILVVMGGTSSEREISLKSGEAMYKALLEKGYNAERFILDKDNAADVIAKKPACVMLALHGRGGEDGSIQGMLEIAGIPYTGSRVASSAMCMDKIFTKKMLAYDGIPTAKFISVLRNERFDAVALADEAIKKLGLPVVVKAPREGSSVGIEIVKEKERLAGAIEEIYKYDSEILLEEFLPGTEMTVPVIKDEEGIKILPIIEIVSENEFYDFESKYTAGMSHHIIPARISADVEEAIWQMAKDTYIAMNCDGLARVDFMLDKDGDPRVVEVNTLPGMTATSLAPDAAAHVGISFADLVEMILKTAVSSIVYFDKDKNK